jgi:hypothetical protein
MRQSKPPESKVEAITLIKKIIGALYNQPNEVKSMWKFSIRNWLKQIAK